MKSFIKYILLLSAATLQSCDYLDIVPDDTVTEESKWADRNTAERTLATCYANLPRLGGWNENPAMMGAGEIIFPNISTWNNEAAMRLLRDQNSSTLSLMNCWEGENGCYAGIRQCNDFLNGVDQVKDLQTFQKERMKAEVIMIKAYLHFTLLRMYGPIYILDVNPPVDQGTADNMVARSSVDECFSYIVNLLDKVIESGALPEIINNRATELGRFTQGAAYFLKARVLTYWASPLFNGNTDYADFTDKDGNPYFNQTPAPQRWTDAAQACEEAIQACNAGGVRLYGPEDFKTRSTLSDATLLTQVLRSSVSEVWNCELVWGSTNSRIEGSIEGNAFAILEGGSGGWKCQSSFGVPFSTVNLFYTRRGLPIEHDKAYDSDNLYTIYKYNRGDSDFNHSYDYDYNEHYVVVDEYNPGMNFDREPRFYSSLGFNRGVWYGNYYRDPTDDRNIQIENGTYAYPHNYFGEFSSVYNSDYYNPTGYWPKKMVSVAMSQSSPESISWSAYPYPDMRFADLLLMAAETLNEAEGPSGKVYGYLDMVRRRAGLEGIVDTYEKYAKDSYKSYPQSKDRLREIIHRERGIELAFEGKKYWDELRWKTAERTFNRALQGWNVLGYSDKTGAIEQAREYYIPTFIMMQEFSHRDYFAPIHDNELNKNPNLSQNPNW